MKALAHSENEYGQVEPLETHLKAVAETAGNFAARFGAKAEAMYCGILHDIGKLGEAFQICRLQKGKKGIDHWSSGAWYAMTKGTSKVDPNCVLAGLAIQGHHPGLVSFDRRIICQMKPEVRTAELANIGGMLSQKSGADYQNWMMEYGVPALPPVGHSLRTFDAIFREPAAAMLDARMLFSTLVDADFLETEAHFNAAADGTRYQRKTAPSLAPKAAIEILERHITDKRNKLLQSGTPPSEKVLDVRGKLLDVCREGAGGLRGLYTLTAPTGSGKTLAMLRFALEHAAISTQEHPVERIVFVIPYLSIIEQTADEYQKIFAPHFGEAYVLEHHSLNNTYQSDGQSDGQDERNRLRTMTTENWDAPVIVTTSVQFLESLFSNRPGACRKIHRLANSIIIFDEVQTLPPKLVVPTLATLSHLSTRYRSTVVFATATQPAFGGFDNAVRKLCVNGWSPQEIVPYPSALFNRTRRNKVDWRHDEPATWEQVADWISKQDQALCIVNLKRHAMTLVRTLQGRSVPGLRHLSTNMCPVHRKEMLDQVRDDLKNGKPCRLVATQCVEAGVDVDFPALFRAFGPLEAIAQAAGRCNRNQRLKDITVTVFSPIDDKKSLYPGGGYGQAAAATEALLNARGPANVDIHNPAVFSEYYHLLYDLTRPERGVRAKELEDAIVRGDFVDVAKLYRIIDRKGISVIVPYHREVYKDLFDKVTECGFNAAWVRSARPYAVSIYAGQDYAGFLQPAPLARRGRPGALVSDEWFFLLDENGKMYDSNLLGLCEAEKDWIA
jgi:CRISPR-associated helicase Cas3/CRISPR-associated endonuclease Cas3-HD